MSRPIRLVIILLVTAGLVLGLGAWLVQHDTPQSAATGGDQDLGQLLGNGDARGYAHADRPRDFDFPADHGAHPRFRNEWWYFTGNLQSSAGRRFGYELALFRIALQPQAPERESDWGTNQVYMGHFAVTDVAGERFYFTERFARGAAGLAGARARPFRVWLEDWQVAAPAAGAPTWRLQARSEALDLELSLTPSKPVVLQGDGGLSQKSAQRGNASYYYSLTRIETAGTLEIEGQQWSVRGLSWMDREWSTSALGPGQTGWDWFSLQLDDGYDLMFYQLRRKDGSRDPHSQGVLVDPDGKTTRLGAEDVQLEVNGRWESPAGGEYPSGWRMRVATAGLTLDIEPLLLNQELDVSVRYWEGAVRASGHHRGQSVTGSGYVELTGYARAGEQP